MTIDFTFHNVGQGLFYSGKVGDFNFIYDCGSERINHLNSVVSNYKNNELIVSRVDLLILSHLHDDHVIGLDALFSSGMTVDTVVLPYLSPTERLMVALKRNDLPDWFYDFLGDPVSFLIKKGARRVIIVGGSKAYSPEHASIDEERDRDKKEGLDLSEMPDDKVLKDEILQKDTHWKELLDTKKLYIKNHRGRITARGLWFFRFFNCKPEDSKRELFEDCVKLVIQNGDWKSVIRSKSQRKKLKNCYEKLQGEFNDTSLVVYHAPIVHALKLKPSCLVFNHWLYTFLFQSGL